MALDMAPVNFGDRRHAIWECLKAWNTDMNCEISLSIFAISCHEVSGLETTVFSLSVLKVRCFECVLQRESRGRREGGRNQTLALCTIGKCYTTFKGEQCRQGCNLGGSSPVLCLLQLLEATHILGHELPSSQILSVFDPLFYLLQGPFWFQPAREDNLITFTVIDS